jgi:hypothetical protein
MASAEFQLLQMERGKHQRPISKASANAISARKNLAIAEKPTSAFFVLAKSKASDRSEASRGRGVHPPVAHYSLRTPLNFTPSAF